MSNNFNYLPKSIDYDRLEYCPKEYQEYLKRILSIQAFAERCGACEMGAQLHLAPDSVTRKSFARIVYDEANHAHMLYKILDKIGVTENEAIELSKSKNSSGKSTESLDGVVAVGNSGNRWIDIVLNNMFLDRAGSYMVANFSNSSFQPWAKACEQIYIDEQFHKAFGLKQLKRYIAKYGINEELKQKIRRWYIYAVNFFGPPNLKSQQVLCMYGIKRLSNEQLRQKFVEEVLIVMKSIGLGDMMTYLLSREYPYQLAIN